MSHHGNDIHNEQQHELALEEGYKAFKSGQAVSQNPYDPDDELIKYEAWVDGWVEGQEETRGTQ